MILPLLLLLQDAPPQDVQAEEDIVVVARKMRFIDVRIVAPRRKGQLVLRHCSLSRPSGYAVLDAIPCDAARECILEKPLNRKILLRCVEQRSNARVDAIIARGRP